jgi:predicted transposase YdaD
LPPDAPPLQKALSLLLLPEEQLPSTADAVRHEATGTPLAEEVDTVIAAILVARFCTRSIPEICAMGGITIEDFTSSAVYKEIFGQGHSEGLQEGRVEGQREGRQAEAAALTLRLLQRRCGSLPPQQQTRLQALPLSRLEALADALLDFQGPDDLTAWLQANGG